MHAQLLYFCLQVSEGIDFTDDNARAVVSFSLSLKCFVFCHVIFIVYFVWEERRWMSLDIIISGYLVWLIE